MLEEQWDEGDGYYEEDEYGFDNDDYEGGYEEPGHASPYNDPNNPLAGKSPQEVAKYMNDWLDEGHDKGEIKGLGMQLMRKVL
jgi:hypothetical protein